MSLLIWTIGHSTRPIEELLALLTAQGISLVVDVRLIPFSRRHPQFNAQALAESLAKAGLHYHHLPALGGRRKARPDSFNLGWRSAGFRGYADYMQTAQFREALEALMAYGKSGTTAIMCAEAVPWRCHRMLIADALVARGWTVRHILSLRSIEDHTLTSFTRLDHDTITYPLPDAEVSDPRLWEPTDS
jgi:uncharacterized protein (DUF488 family)